MPTLKSGDPAPPFTLPAAGGSAVSLKDFAGRKLVLFFYPKANTPGCTREAIAFSELKDQFARTDTDIIGVSADPVKSQDAFVAKHGLLVPVASDENHEMLEAYGVWGQKTNYGKTYMGISRTTFLIDRHGAIARVWRKVKVDGHADEVLAAAQEL